MYVDPKEEGLALRTINSSKSAFASYVFNPQFFSSYSHKISSDPNGSRYDIPNLATQRQSQRKLDAYENDVDSQDNNSKCKVTMRVSVNNFGAVQKG